MRREGNIINEIVEYSNMAEAFDTVLHGTARKRSRVGRYLMEHREDVIKELSESIMNGIPEEIDFHERIIVEGVKPRRIQVISMKSRIKASAVMNVVDKHIKKRFIRTTSASIKNRGMHDLLNYIRRDMQEDPEGTMYCYKFDCFLCVLECCVIV